MENQEMNETVETNTNSNIQVLLKRVSLFLEDKNWEKADEYCERVLDQDPENAQAYLGKLMVEMRVSRLEEFVDCQQSFENNNNYQKILRFGEDNLKDTLNGYIAQIQGRNEASYMLDTYNEALSVMKSAKSKEEFLAAAEGFGKIPGFNDADSLAEQCLAQAEISPRQRRFFATKQNNQKGNIFKKKGFLAAIIALAIIIVAVVLIIVFTSSSVDKELVGLWVSDSETDGHSSYLYIERNGKCSGITVDLFGSMMLFRGVCETDNDILGIEVKEITSSYVNEEEVLSNKETIGFYIAGYQYSNPVLLFAKIKESGKGNYVNQVLYGYSQKASKTFIKTNNKADIKAYKEIIKSWFERSTSEESATEHYTAPPEIVSEPETTTLETTTPETTTQEIVTDGIGDQVLAAVDELMFRSGPGTEYSAIAKLYVGDSFKVIERKNGWVHGNFGGMDGWASEEYLVPLSTYYSVCDFLGTMSSVETTLYYRGSNETYSYYQAYSGGGWQCVKVKKTDPYSVEYMNDAERAQYEQNPYAGAGY